MEELSTNMLGPAHIAAYIFEICSLGYFIFLTRKHRIEIWEAIKGEDGKLQLTEIAAFYWFMLFPILFFGDLFFNMKASAEIWYSMDFVFFTIIGGHAYINKQKRLENDDISRTSDSEN
jgi:hypothetical protein